MSQTVELKRSVSLPFLILYGLGTMVGGGFYALVGRIAAEAGLFAPLALVLAGVFALITGLSFAELSSRFPVSAGEVRYVREGFGSQKLAQLTGALVILTGVVSAAALAVATIGFLQDFVPVHEKAAIGLLVLGMGAVAAWGIGQSVGIVTIITLIEVGALLYAVFAADTDVGQMVENWRSYVPPLEGGAWLGIFAGAFLGLYAFIGFEDMVNIAEEVTDVRRSLPLAIAVSVVTTMALYLLVSVTAVSAVPPERLAASNTPIAEMVGDAGWYSTVGLGLVSLLAGINGALVQVIMASRVAYGMAHRGQAPAWLAAVHPKTHTPLKATAAVTGVIVMLALFLPLTTLARFTSGIILVVFGGVNLALWLIKRREPDLDGVGPRLPSWLPLVGAFSCFSVLLFQIGLSGTDLLEGIAAN